MTVNAEGAPSGQQLKSYTLRQIGSTTNDDNAIIRVLILANQIAADDTITDYTGVATTFNPLLNDTRDRGENLIHSVTLEPTADPNPKRTVTISAVGSWPAGFTLNTSNGLVNVPAGLLPGTYTMQYSIFDVPENYNTVGLIGCDPSQIANNSDTATITLVVRNLLDAVNDSFGTVGAGSATPSVFDNDLAWDGTPATSSNIDVTLTDNDGITGATINPDGTINIPAGTTPGAYTLTYQICSPAGQTNDCDTANVEITVLAVCYNPVTNSNTGSDTKIGISALQREAGENIWPMNRKSAYIALESKTKGFVVTRMTDPENIADPVVGMMVFDTNENSGVGCLKINTDGTAAGWRCFSTAACPEPE